MVKDLLVAQVLKPQGIRGEIKVKVLTDTADDLAALPRIFIDGTEYKLLKVRGDGDCAYLTLKGIADRNAAELLRGKEVCALREDAPPLPENRFYIVDVIGCEVQTESGERLGSICEITPAATDIFTLYNGVKKIPFVAAEGVIISIDTENKKMVVNGQKYRQVALLD